MDGNECGLGAFAVAIMLVSHPERLQHHDDLWIDCAGDEYVARGGGGRFSCAPRFLSGGGIVWFDSGWSNVAEGHYGSASGFVPQP
jgi:hypothetical protein